MRITRPACFAILAAAPALFAAVSAHAQIPNVDRPTAPLMKPDAVPQKSEAPPPALPGAASKARPAERTALDLSPTDALFDSINRGDLAGARDAINRGADINGQNILGMTPVDVSVDLSRNDITFLLLSMRGSGNSTPTRTAANGASVIAAADKVQAGKTARTPPAKAAAVAKVQKVAAARPVPAPAAAPAPQQFAGPAGTGTPNPQAGFLGFGGVQ